MSCLFSLLAGIFMCLLKYCKNYRVLNLNQAGKTEIKFNMIMNNEIHMNKKEIIRTQKVI